MEKDAIREAVTARIMGLFDVPVIQNNLRGLWIESMVVEILGEGWRHVGTNWSAYDVRHDTGISVEVKQSAKAQSWGISKATPRFNTSIAAGHYPDGVTYEKNIERTRFADYYVFAWHEGSDQREVEEWTFFAVKSTLLPPQASISLNHIHNLAVALGWRELRCFFDGVVAAKSLD